MYDAHIYIYMHKCKTEIKETSNKGASPWSQTCFFAQKNNSWNSLSKGVLFSAGIALLQLKKAPCCESKCRD